MNKKIRTLVMLSCFLLVFSSCNTAQTDSTGLKIFRAANLAHGGDNLDNLKTIRIKDSNSFGYENITLIDFINQKYRYERRKNNTLVIDQLEKNEAWTWANNKKSSLSERQKSILKLGFCLSELGLRSECLKTISFGETIIDEEAKVKYLTVIFDKEEFGYVIDENNRLKELTKFDRGINNRVVFDDFRSVNGIIFAFSKTSKSSNPNQPIIGAKDVVTRISSIEVNPEFTENDWAVPN
jgi:hypothetical protein